jgi:hypothetical protein
MESTSKAVQTRGCSEGLLRLKRQFDQWRAGRRAGERIPSELWSGAVAAAGEHGAYRVAAELHLDYAVLKRRAALAGGSTSAAELAPRFVELFAPAGRTAPAGAAPPACVIEMDNARGAKMRVELGGNGLAAGLSVLCSAFWSA